MAQPVLEPPEPPEPLVPLYQVERPKALIRPGIAPIAEGADILIRDAISEYGGIAGKTVVIDCRDHRRALQQFADRLVWRLFEQGVAEVAFYLPSPELFEAVLRSARRIGAEDRVRIATKGVLAGLE